MKEATLVGIGLVLAGVLVGLVFGSFIVVLPTSDPYLSQYQEDHFTCSAVNATSINCVGSGATIFYQVCITSYWWGQMCRTYKTVNS